jgi:hypothetical protein
MVESSEIFELIHRYIAAIRNLWPLEIAFMWAVVAVPASLGVQIGKYSGEPRSRRHR